VGVPGWRWQAQKPVKTYLVSTLALRAYLPQEVRLNRRLAPGIYLGVVPLVQDRRGRLRLGGPGPIVDWLVHAPPSGGQALDRLAPREPVPLPAVDEVARRLTAFCRSARRSDHR
jgi:aminoglycoside phosphotransferase family enzyme